MVKDWNCESPYNIKDVNVQGSMDNGMLGKESEVKIDGTGSMQTLSSTSDEDKSRMSEIKMNMQSCQVEGATL